MKYYEQKTRPSSRIAARDLAAELGDDWRQRRGWDVERWFERLPMYLLEEPKRQKVLKAFLRSNDGCCAASIADNQATRSFYADSSHRNTRRADATA